MNVRFYPAWVRVFLVLLTYRLRNRIPYWSYGWNLLTQTTLFQRLGYLPQHFGAYPQLSAFEFLDYMGRLGGLHDKRQRRERVEQVLHDVALYEARDRKAGTFSGGMRRRLGIAQAIIADPEFIIVDEPTVGLDPEERIRFRGILSRLSAKRTIIISTHIVGDISSTCEDLAVLRQGQLLFHGAPEDFIAKAEGKTWLLQTDDDAFETIANRFNVTNINADGVGMELRIVGDEAPPCTLAKACDEHEA